MIYADYNATAPVLPSVKSAAVDMLDMWGNPSSIHKMGQEAKHKIEHTRALLAEHLGVLPRDVTFTSGGTEANNLALHCLGIPNENIYCSAIEHKSVLNIVPTINHIRVTNDGLVDLEHIRHILTQQTSPTLISIMWANNETGATQPIEDIADLCHQHGAYLHVDAIQAFGRLPISLLKNKIHLLTVSAHKIGGLKGAGAVISAPNLKMKPLLIGTGQERGLRAGTENTVALASWAAAIEEIDFNKWTSIAATRDWLENELKKVSPEALVISKHAARLPNTLCICTPGHAKEKQVIFFDLNGIALSSGSACSSGKVMHSHALKAMGLTEEYTGSSLRISLPHTFTQQDAQRLLSVYTKMVGVSTRQTAIGE